MSPTRFDSCYYLILLIIIGFCFVKNAQSIECYTGIKLIQGTSVGSATIRCDNPAAYCYNMTASTNVLIDVMKAGCSMWRCLRSVPNGRAIKEEKMMGGHTATNNFLMSLAQNKCISTTFKNIPISLCCCNTPYCNVAENSNIIRPQNSGQWNAEPPSSKQQWTHDEVERTFQSAEIDDDHHVDEKITAMKQSTNVSENQEELGNETVNAMNTTLGDEIELLLK